MACIKAFWISGFTSMLWIYLLCPLVSCAIFLEAGPQNKTVVEGDEVALICDVNNDNDNTIFWTYLIEPGRRRYISTNNYVYPSSGYGVDPENYKVIIDQSQQIYKLIILAINLSTEAGIYDCGYTHGSNSKYTPLASARITVSPFQQSVICHQNRLSSLGSEENQEFEVACSWTHRQPSEAYFDSSSGQTIDVDLRFPGRIISRIESRDTPSIICRIMLDSDASVTINAPCIGDNTPGLVRVDPFISEVALGSSASFVCTSGNQNYSPEISWNVNVNGSEPLDSQNRLIENNDVLSIVNVQDNDQDMLVECQVHISEDLVVSSYASLRIVEVTTPPSQRPPGESQSNRTIDRTTTEISITDVTRPLPLSKSGIMVIALTVVIIFVLAIIALVIIIFILVRRRNRRHLRRKYGEEKAHTYDAIELQKIPHTKPDGSSQLYAVSFKDKKSKRHRSVGIEGEDADETHFKRSFSSSCGVLNMQPESTDEQIYAEPDATTTSENQLQKNSRRLCNSMPILDNSEYESISDPTSRSKQITKTLSTLSVSSNRSSHGDRRWTSQRLKKDAPWTPPMSRHATSFRKPVNKDSNVDSDYTKMTIENKISTDSDVTKSPGRVPLYAKPDKTKKKSRNNELSSTGNKANEADHNVGSDYADIEDVGSRSQHTDDDEFIDTYLGNIQSSFNSSLTKNMKNNKATSLNRSTSSRPGPSKPQRGKCQSMGITTYQTISDYEIMSNQVKQINEDDDDYNKCALSEPSLQMSNYDRPGNSTRVKTSHTLPRLSETTTEAMMQEGYGREGRRVKSLDQGEYEFIGNEGGFRKNSTEVPPSPQYADIGETMNAYASVLDCDVSASEWRQEDDNDYSDID